MNIDPDAPLVEALRRGDEMAFMMLVTRYQTSLVRTALLYVADREVAEEVVQETWLGVLRGVKAFEGRATLKTWLFSILVNRAKTRAVRDRRDEMVLVAFDDPEPAGPSVSPERFYPHDHPDEPDSWVSPVQSWDEMPEERLLSRETQSLVKETIDSLPPAQRQVITLRDIEGWSADEVCEVMNITAVNQRVLLHRARSVVRGALERYFEGAK
jgi:RNA polymerase sigma-70 factor (ECF subfamily)